MDESIFMPTSESMKKDMHSSGYAQKEKISSYLKEVIKITLIIEEWLL